MPVCSHLVHFIFSCAAVLEHMHWLTISETKKVKDVLQENIE